MLPTPEPDLGNASGGKSLVAFYVSCKTPLPTVATCDFVGSLTGTYFIDPPVAGAWTRYTTKRDGQSIDRRLIRSGEL